MVAAARDIWGEEALAAGAASARAKAEEAVKNGKRLERLTAEDIDGLIEVLQRPRPVFPADYLAPFRDDEKARQTFIAAATPIIEARQRLWDREKEILDHYYVYGYTHIVLDDDDDDDDEGGRGSAGRNY